MNLNSSIELLPHTSNQTINRLKKLGIHTLLDLINYFPFRYENFQLIKPIINLQEDEIVTVIGTIIKSDYQVTRNGLKIQKFIISDKTGSIEASWYNQPYLLSLLKQGSNIAISGQIKKYGRKYTIFPKEYELLKKNDYSQLKHTGRLVPVYQETRGLSSKTLREKIWSLIHQDSFKINEYFPKTLVNENNLIDINNAYLSIHFPSNLQAAEDARKRLAFDELFFIQLSSFLIRKEWSKEIIGHPYSVKKYKNTIENFIANLPFSLTKAQIKVINEIFGDFEKPEPMNRLLQGDVGSGKTVVAAIASYLTYLNDYQTLIMSPTEILAQQHYQTIKSLFKSQSKTPNIILITGTIKPTTEKIANADIIIGTHALIQKKINFKKVGLVIIDEQHRFGVKQRAELKNKGLNPHLLSMTATPIPRTVMLTIYGELDISIIDEVPANRQPVKSYLIDEAKRNSCYSWIKKQIKINKTQVFIVCPLIEESSIETASSIKAAKKEFLYLQEKIFPELKLGLLHGKLKSDEKNKIMNQFVNHKINILVTTSIVEVGVDIPNATIMIIEGAEKFGLAQLHQLRGRIGRGNKQSYCFLFCSNSSLSKENNRLAFFVKNNNGNDLAEMDLTIRGPGNIYGTEQHGYADLKIASLNDYHLIVKTKKAVDNFIRNYSFDKFEDLMIKIEKYRLKKISQD